MNDYELLSAYIDGELTEDERQTVETRLKNEPALRRELQALRQTVALIQQLPALKAPRNYTLTPDMVAKPPERELESPPARTPRNVIPLPLVSALSSAAAAILIIAGVVLLGMGDGDTDTMSQDPVSVDVASAPTETATIPTSFTNLGELSTADRLTIVAQDSLYATESANLDQQQRLIETDTANLNPGSMQQTATAQSTPLRDADVYGGEGAAESGASTMFEPPPEPEEVPESVGADDADEALDGDFEVAAESDEEESDSIADDDIANDSAMSAGIAPQPSPMPNETTLENQNAPAPIIGTIVIPAITDTRSTADEAETDDFADFTPPGAPLETAETTAEMDDLIVPEIAEAGDETDGTETDLLPDTGESTRNQAILEDSSDRQNTLGIVLIVAGLFAVMVAVITWWLPRRRLNG